MDKKAETTSEYLSKAAAWKFIILVGVVSLFSDMTYEGARSISGPGGDGAPGPARPSNPLTNFLRLRI